MDLLFLSLCPLKVVLEQLERQILIWNVIVRVSIGVNVERSSKLPIALLSCTFVITFQGFALRTAWVQLRRQAFGLLLSSLAITRDEDFQRAWLIFLAGEGGMTLLSALMIARLALLPTLLSAMRAYNL